MPISYSKVYSLHYGSSYNKHQYAFYFPGNTVIPRVKEPRDLGIFTCDSFNYTKYINYITASTRRLIGMVIYLIETKKKISLNQNILDAHQTEVKTFYGIPI